jgi:hypothetical protein
LRRPPVLHGSSGGSDDAVERRLVVAHPDVEGGSVLEARQLVADLVGERAAATDGVGLVEHRREVVVPTELRIADAVGAVADADAERAGIEAGQRFAQTRLGTRAVEPADRDAGDRDARHDAAIVDPRIPHHERRGERETATIVMRNADSRRRIAPPPCRGTAS